MTAQSDDHSSGGSSASVPCADASSNPASGVFSSASTTCVSGSPNRALNSITLVPCEVSASPAYNSPENGVPRRAISSTVGWSTVRNDLVDQPLGRPGQRGVGPHAAGVGPVVHVVGALEVLGRLQRHHGHAVGDREQRHLGAVEVLLDHHGLAARVLDRLVERGRHDHTLAGGQAIVLDDVRRLQASREPRPPRHPYTPSVLRSAHRLPASRPWRTPCCPRAAPRRRKGRTRRSRGPGRHRRHRRPAAPRARRRPGRRATARRGPRPLRHR